MPESSPKAERWSCGLGRAGATVPPAGEAGSAPNSRQKRSQGGASTWSREPTVFSMFASFDVRTAHRPSLVCAGRATEVAGESLVQLDP